ncbi:MAG: hypothetical protein NZ772_05080 [Cyanobacteria bacterium]|nr:hypothetical protein [Cyanobacteriota bacterium]MDW8200868.1 hypothetical protein [Cyanobacteriota bacterium SKYGB_h_bin112]
MGIYKSAILKTLTVVLVLSVIGFSTVGNSGVSWDELTGILSVRQNIEVITKGKPIEGIFQYDGTVFNVAAEAVYQARRKLRQILFKADVEADLTSEQILRKKFEAKHAFTFFTSLLCYLAVAALVGTICGMQYAWFGALNLAFFPRFWGDSFFNFKDVPFATFFTISTLASAYLVNEYLKNDRVHVGFNRLTGLSVLYGILMGILTGVRAGGFVIITYIAIGYVILQLGNSWNTIRHEKRRLIKIFFNFFSFYILIVIVWFITTTICYPSSWSNPIVWFIGMIKALSSYAWGITGSIFFNGQYISGLMIPRSYIPVWFTITTPVIFQVAFFLGLLLLYRRYSNLSNLQKATVILTLLQIFLLPSLIIIRRSVIYDGIRHVLFILPGVCVIASVALIWIYELLNKKSLKIFVVMILLGIFVQICWEMVQLHPYEYIYFNSVVGGLRRASTLYEVEYWGLSMREATEWVNQHGNKPASILIGGPAHSVSVFADPDIKLFTFEFRNNNPDRPIPSYLARSLPADLPKSFYYIAIRSGSDRYDQELLSCPLVHAVKRKDVPLAVVRYCSQ